MSRKHRHEPKITAWRSMKHLLDLRGDLFSPNCAIPSVRLTPDVISKQRRGIVKLRSYETKSKLPHCVSITGQLISLQHEIFRLRTQDQQKDIAILEDQLKMAVSMTIIRFVNGLLDPGQQGQFAIPLNVLARKINLPSWFVELRHAGTHGALSSLEMLEIALDGAVDWTWNNYWIRLDEKETENDESEEESVRELEEQLKNYRRFKRDHLNKKFKVGDTSEAGKEYWKIMSEISSSFEENETVSAHTLARFLAKYKFEQGKVLYQSLLDYICQEQMNMVLKFLDIVSREIHEFSHNIDVEDASDGNAFKIRTNRDLKIMGSWTKWLVLEKVDLFYKTQNFVKLIDILGKRNCEINREILLELRSFTDLVDNELIEKINSRINKKSEAKKRNLDDLDIDSLTNDLANLKKKVKLNKSERQDVKLFVKHANWEPKPFGVFY